MTQDEILKMARDAGFISYSGHAHSANKSHIETFAKLVAQRERDKLFVMFMEAHEGAKHSHNYWHVAANKIKGEA